MMDASGSMGSAHYRKQKNFVKSIVSQLRLSSPASRAAVLVFSDSATLPISLTSFSSMDGRAFESAVDALPFDKGRTRIDKALRLATTNLFTDARRRAVKVSLVGYVYL